MPSCQASTPSVTVADVREVDGNAVLFLEEPQTQTPSTSGASRCGWLPGHNTIGFMSRGRSIHEQAQCLLVNAVEVCHRVRDTKGQTGVSKRQRVQALESCSGRELLVELRKRIRGNDSKAASWKMSSAESLACPLRLSALFGTWEPKLRSRRPVQNVDGGPTRWSKLLQCRNLRKQFGLAWCGLPWQTLGWAGLDPTSVMIFFSSNWQGPRSARSI